MDRQNQPHRRDALGALAGAAALGAGLASAKADAANPVIEWNYHLFSSNVAKFPYHPQAAYKPDPAKNPADPLAEYQKRLKAEGIDKALFVQPEPYGDDHTLVLDSLARTSPEASVSDASSSPDSIRKSSKAVSFLMYCELLPRVTL